MKAKGKESLVRFRHLNEMEDTTSNNEKNRLAKINYGKLDTFHRAISPVMTLAQCLAIMPVSGVRNPNPNHLKFSVKAIVMIPASLFIFLGSILTILFFNSILKAGLNAKSTVGIVFFSCGISASVLFMYLARDWPDLMRNWIKTELIFLFPPYELPQMKLSTKIHMAAFIVILSALVEHGLFFSSNGHAFRMHKIGCNKTETLNLRTYFMDHFGYLFAVIPYSVPVVIVGLIVNFLFTFIWNYMDLFIIMVSLGLSVRFEQLNQRISSLARKDVPEEIWMTIRHDFVLLCELLEKVDRTLSGIILLSSLNNLYFVCFQLLNILNKLRYTINYIYFWFSLLYLVARTVSVFLCAASINDEAAKPLKTLRVVPSRVWCSEVERFIEQTTTQSVALSGMKFFYLTRKLVFGMAGTIVTYELVLLQFDEPNRVKGLGPLCE